ncbi:MAG: hypothetical protein ACYDGU_11965 [Acidiferrobacterales bacterium]
MRVRATGLVRTMVVVGLINFAHNLRRLITMHRLQLLVQACG